MAMAALVTATGFTSCSSDDLDTNQYNKSGVNILAFGPMPITRGETMRLTGTKLDNVREVLFPEGNQKLTPSTTYIAGEFSVKSAADHFFFDYFEPAVEGEDGKWVSASAIFEHLKQKVGISLLKPANVSTFGRMLSNITTLQKRETKYGSEYFVKQKKG